jgi:hypothetical protein
MYTTRVNAGDLSDTYGQFGGCAQEIANDFILIYFHGRLHHHYFTKAGRSLGTILPYWEATR